MENKQEFISISLDDGSVSIMGLISQGRGSDLPWGAEWLVDGWWKRNITDDIINQEIGRCEFEGKSVVSWRRISQSEIPQDRTYRNALKDDGVKLGFDMVKAREIHKSRIRRTRVRLFEKNDIDLRDAILDNDKKKTDDAKKKRDSLRDATDYPAIESAKTIEELKAAIPPEFGELD